LEEGDVVGDSTARHRRWGRKGKEVAPRKTGQGRRASKRKKKKRGPKRKEAIFCGRGGRLI